MQRSLYDKFAPKMMGICVRYLKDRERAKDILQDGFVKIFMSIKSYSGSGSFEGWMKRVFINTALEYLRKADALRHSVDYEVSAQVSGLTVDPLAVAQLSANDVMAMVMQLPDGYRTVFNLFAIEGYTHKEIADMLNITESTSRSQYTRARQLLQKQLQHTYNEEIKP